VSMRFVYYLSARCPVCASISTPICEDFEKVFPGIVDRVYVDRVRVGPHSFLVDPRGYSHRVLPSEGRVPVFLFRDPPPVLWRSESMCSVRVGVSTRSITGYELAHKVAMIYLLERGFDLYTALRYVGRWMDQSRDYVDFLEIFRESAYEGGLGENAFVNTGVWASRDLGGVAVEV